MTILCLPPHTTHAAQPLDVSFFGPLKKHWSSVCHTYMAENPGKVVTKFSFSSLFSQAWYKAIKPETIVAGFRKVGVCPFDNTAISLPILMEANQDKSSNELGNEEGIGRSGESEQGSWKVTGGKSDKGREVDKKNSGDQNSRKEEKEKN